MWQYNNGTTELYHYGVLGMKWGVRRYQNKDGTLTGAGKKRYADGASEETFKRDLKQMRSRNGIKIDYEKSKDGNVKVKGVYSSDGKIRGEKYAQYLMQAHNNQLARQKAAFLVGSAVAAAGASYVARLR